MTNRDELTNTATAYRTWSELKAACRAGYIPSLRSKRPHECRLGWLLANEGLEVFWG